MKFKAILAFVGAGMLTLALSGPAFAGDLCTDTDSDGVCDIADNCSLVANPGQRDDDLDGYGNICDGDLNQDCIVGGADSGLIAGSWLTVPPWLPNPNGAAVGTTGAYDINEDNVVGGADSGAIAGNWLGPAGPSGYACSAWCVGTTFVGPVPTSCP